MSREHDPCCPFAQTPQGWCACTAIAQAREEERQTIEGVLADAFLRHPESSRDAWQDALHAVSIREYQRGLNEGLADD